MMIKLIYHLVKTQNEWMKTDRITISEIVIPNEEVIRARQEGYYLKKIEVEYR